MRKGRERKKGVGGHVFRYYPLRAGEKNFRGGEGPEKKERGDVTPAFHLYHKGMERKLLRKIKRREKKKRVKSSPCSMPVHSGTEGKGKKGGGDFGKAEKKKKGRRFPHFAFSSLRRKRREKLEKEKSKGEKEKKKTAPPCHR